MHLFNLKHIGDMNMEELSFDNILSADEIENMFEDNEEPQDSPPEQTEEKETEETTEVTNPENLFGDEEPESVSSEEITEEQEDTKPNKVSDNSPKPHFYSSITEALAEEGIFPDLDEESIANIKTAEDFRNLIEQQIKAGIDEKQRRIDEALSAGVEPTEIQKYEQAIDYLNSITDENINDESEKGETLRKQLIYRDFINRGYSKERALREVNKSFNSGSDIEDAKEALASNKEFFESAYDDLIKEAQEEDNRQKKERKDKAEMLKKTIFEDKEIFGEIALDKNTRQKVYDNISKPVYKDPDTGELLTAVQKYEKENSVEFLKNVGILYTLTDGFKNIDKLVKGKVKKEVKKGLRNLETMLNNTSRTFDGNLKFTSGVGDDPESSARDWDLDI